MERAVLAKFATQLLATCEPNQENTEQISQNSAIDRRNEGLSVIDGNEAVHGHESQIAIKLQNTQIGKDSTKLARILELEAETDLIKSLSFEQTAYARILSCLQLWISRNGAKSTTMANLIERFKINEEVHCAEIVQDYQENVVAKRIIPTSPPKANVDANSRLEILNQSLSRLRPHKFMGSQISIGQSTIDIPKRRLARVSEHLVKIPFEFVKEFFYEMGLVTRNALQRIEVICLTNEEKVTRLIVTEAIACLTSDIIPDLTNYLKVEYGEITSMMKEESLLQDQLDLVGLPSLNFTFALLKRISELKNILDRMPEASLKHLKLYLREKEAFYKNWIKLICQFATNVTIISVSVQESLLSQVGLSCKPENRLDSLEAKSNFLSKLIEEARGLLRQCQTIFQNFKSINEEASKIKNLLNTSVLQTIIDSGPDEIQWIIYTYDCLKFEHLLTEVRRAEEVNVNDNRDNNFEYLEYVSSWSNWSRTVHHFAKFFVKNSVHVESNIYGLTPWNRNFFRLKDSFLKLKFELIAPLLVTHGAIDLPFYRALSCVLNNPLHAHLKIKATISFEKTQSNHYDVMNILFQKISKSQNRRRNRATLHALKHLNDSNLTNATIDKFISPSVLDSLVRRKKSSKGISDPEMAICSVNEHLEYGGNEALSVFGIARLNSILTWVTKTTGLGSAMCKCRKLVDGVNSEVKPIWEKFVDEGEVQITQAEVSIDNYSSLCQEVKHSYNAILLTLEALRDERQVSTDSKDKESKLSMLQLLEKAEISISEENTGFQANWLKNQKLGIEDEALEFEEVIELVRNEMFGFDVMLIKAKHCCTIIDTFSNFSDANGNEGVYGHLSQIAARLVNTAIGKDSKKFARVLDLEADPDLLEFLSTESAPLVRNSKCLQTWIDRFGAKNTTMGNLINILKTNGEVFCAEIVEIYRENVFPKAKNECQLSENHNEFPEIEGAAETKKRKLCI